MVLDYHVLNGDGIVTLITWQDGGPLFRDGKIGTEQDCCCDGGDAPLGSCCGWICDYVADIIWPDIENPEDIPAYEPPEGWFAGGPGFLTKTINGVEDCDDPDFVEAKVAELQAELDAVVAPLGGFSVVSLNAETSGLGCLPVEVTEQTCSDTYAGTWYATFEECLENCNPLP